MTRLAALVPLFLLGGCSPADHAVIVDEPMTWHVSKDRSLIELRYVHDSRYFVTICSSGVLDHLQKLPKHEVSVQHRVWG